MAFRAVGTILDVPAEGLSEFDLLISIFDAHEYKGDVAAPGRSRAIAPGCKIKLRRSTRSEPRP